MSDEPPPEEFGALDIRRDFEKAMREAGDRTTWTAQDADYEAAGGHAGDSVRGAVLDDVSLARAVQRTGRGVTVFGGRGAVRFRMYPDGLRSLVEGWTKNFAGGAAGTGSGVRAASRLPAASCTASNSASMPSVQAWPKNVPACAGRYSLMNVTTLGQACFMPWETIGVQNLEIDRPVFVRG